MFIGFGADVLGEGSIELWRSFFSCEPPDPEDLSHLDLRTLADSFGEE